MTTASKFQLGSEREETPRGDRLLGLQKLQENNRACEHVVVVGDGVGAATLALKMRGQDVCPHCTRREAAYWRERAKTAEGLAAALGEYKTHTQETWKAAMDAPCRRCGGSRNWSLNGQIQAFCARCSDELGIG